MTRLSKSDLCCVIDTLHDLAADTSGDIFPRPMIERLGELLGAPNAGYCDLDLATCNGYFIRTLPEPEWFGEALYRWGHQDPIVCTRFAGSERAVAVSDLMSRRAFNRLDLYQHTLRPFGCADAMRLYLPGNARARFFFFDRERWGVTMRERELLDVLRPHFALHRQRWRPTQPSINSLTAREREILEATAEGQTNAQIAQTLCISPHTVRTHLEHIFEKLDVRTRTEAAARLAPAAVQS